MRPISTAKVGKALAAMEKPPGEKWKPPYNTQLKCKARAGVQINWYKFSRDMHERLHNAAESRRHRSEGSHQCNGGVVHADIQPVLQGRARVQA